MRDVLRPLHEADYARLAPLFTAVYPDYPSALSELRHRDQHRSAPYLCERWVVVRDEAIIGLGSYEQHDFTYAPDQFTIDIMVHPLARRQGVGRTLYDQTLAALAALAPRVLLADVRETDTDGVTFVERRGYVEKMREWESRLTVADFDPTPFATVIDEMTASGITIATMAELAGDPERDRKIYDLCGEVELDVPSPKPTTVPDFGHWLKNHLYTPHRLPAAFFIALDGDRYVGISWLNAIDDDPGLETGLTGVRRSHRRRGIALALKLTAIAYARAHGHTVIKTWNETGNEGMLAINQRLGFVRQPAWIAYVKILSREQHEA